MHGAALLALPPEMSNIDRWIDVVVAVLVVAVVVRTLAARNERLVANLEAEARVDPLTGLLNRRGLEERLGAELSRAARDDSALGAVAFDLDHFKQVNDEHGHEIGDRVLAWLGALLRGAGARRRRGRAGGRRGVRRAAAARGRGRRGGVRRARAARRGDARAGDGAGAHGPLRVAAPERQRRPSPPPRRSTAARCWPAADQALYAAKRAGRNRTVVGPRHAGAGAVEAAV